MRNRSPVFAYMVRSSCNPVIFQIKELKKKVYFFIYFELFLLSDNEIHSTTIMLTLLILTVLSCSIHSSLTATPFKDCGSELGIINAFQVTNCDAAPCKFMKGQTYAMNLTFQAKAPAKSATLILHGKENDLISPEKSSFLYPLKVSSGVFLFPSQYLNQMLAKVV